MEEFRRWFIDSISSFEAGITDFIAAGERAYLAGFTSAYWGKGPGTYQACSRYAGTFELPK